MKRKNIRPNLDIDQSMSKKTITLLLFFGALFTGLAYIGWHRISNFETGLVFAVEAIVASSCFWGFFCYWIPNNLRTRYVWYFIDTDVSDHEVVCQIRDDVPSVPVAFHIKVSGWLGKSQVYIDRQPTDQWQVTVDDPPPLGIHKLTIYDKQGLPFIPGRVGYRDAVRHQLWLIGKFEDLDQHWMYLYSLGEQRKTLLGAMCELRELSQPNGPLGNKWPVKVLHEFAADKVKSTLSTADILGKQDADEVMATVKFERYSSRTRLETLVRFSTPRSRTAGT